MRTGVLLRPETWGGAVYQRKRLWVRNGVVYTTVTSACCGALYFLFTVVEHWAPGCWQGFNAVG